MTPNDWRPKLTSQSASLGFLSHPSVPCRFLLVWLFDFAPLRLMAPLYESHLLAVFATLANVRTAQLLLDPDLLLA